MSGGIVAGLGFGVGIALLLAWAWPARPSLAASVALLRAGTSPTTATPATSAADASGWQLRVGRLAVAACRGLGLEFARLGPDLAVVERSLEAHLARKVLEALVGAAAVPAATGLLMVAGVRVGWQVPAWLAAGLALLGFWLPDRRLHTAAAARRRAMRSALGMLLNVVAVNLAGGAEVEEALHNAAEVGRGWAFSVLRQTMEQARWSREKVWVAWGQLGERLQVAELRQLAQHLALAGDEGARMRQALVAMAQTIRRNELAAAEIHATEAGERMVLPLSLLSTGFLLLLAVPALLQIAATFGLG
jgi:Flp pilus assembly protein TadB